MLLLRGYKFQLEKEKILDLLHDKMTVINVAYFNITKGKIKCFITKIREVIKYANFLYNHILLYTYNIAVNTQWDSAPMNTQQCDCFH